MRDPENTHTRTDAQAEVQADMHAGADASHQVRAHASIAQFAVDLILCLVVVATSSYVTGGGFYVAPDLQASPLILFVLPLVLLFLLHLAAQPVRFRIIAVILAVIVVVAAVVYAISLAPVDQVLADQEDNPVIFILVVLITTLAVFFLSRTRPGCIILVIVEIINVFLIQFLYYHDYIVPSFICLVATLALLVFSVFRHNTYATHDRAGTRTTLQVFATTVVTGLLLAALAAGAFVAIVEPLHPQALPLKLITRVMALEEVEVEGIADMYPLVNDDLSSEEERDSEDMSNALGDEESAPEEDGGESTLSGGFSAFVSGLFDLDFPNQVYDVINYTITGYIWLLIVLLIIAAIVVAILIKLHRRRVWAERVCALDIRDQALAYGHFFIDRLALMGFTWRSDMTPAEYVTDNLNNLQRFFVLPDTQAGSESSPRIGKELFKSATCSFEQACYGDHDMDEQQVTPFRSLYQRFYRCCRAYLGNFGYIRKFFRL